MPHVLFGRDAALDRVATALAAGQPLAIVGEAGIGKTTLIRAAAERAALELREGGALETLGWMPLLALRRAVGDDLAGDATAVAIEVERRVGPQLLFIDDLQWADPLTRQVLALLVGRVALVVAIRVTDPAAGDARTLAAELGVGVIELQGVDRSAATEIVRRARPNLDAAAAELLVAEGAGNPLLLEELALRGRPTSNLARALTSRLEALGPAGRDAFALLAVAGHAMPIEALGAGASELVASGAAVATDGQLAPRHALLAEAMVGTLSPTELQGCHARLVGLVADDGERAHHLAGAGRRAEAFAAAREAAGSATTRMARAALLELAAKMSDGPESAPTRIAAARLLVAEGGSACRAAIVLLEPEMAGRDELLVERQALLAKAHFEIGDLVASRAAYDRGRALDAGHPSAAGVALAVGEAAFVLNVDGDGAAAKRLLVDAIAAGGPVPRAVATLETMTAFHDGVDTFDAVAAAYAELVAQPSEVVAAFGVARNAAYIALLYRGYEATHAFLARAARDFEALQLPGRADELRAEDVQVLLFAGRLDEGLALADTLLERPLGQRPRQWAATKRTQILAALGQDTAGEILTEIDSWVTDDFAGRGEVLEARVEVESWAGRPQAVLDGFAAYVAMPSPSHATDIMPLLGAQWARLDLGLEPGEAVVPQPWRLLAAASFESEGIRALAAGDDAAAARSFAQAERRWADFHVGRELTCGWAHGEALRRSGSAAAAEVLRDVLARADAHGYGPLAARARRSLRLAGVRLAPPRRDSAEAPRWARMTHREREVLQLVGRGLTTPQIARRMGLGRGTVDQVLGSATRKLGAASRIQAAAMLAEALGGGRRSRRVATVRTAADAGEVVLAALAGASVTVDPDADPALVERIQADLRRLGRDDAITLGAVGRGTDLDPDGTSLLGLLVDGRSLGEAAAALHLSRRTADRRLAAARTALGVATTAEALLAFQSREVRD